MTMREAHVLVFPYPTQGHINPLLQFAKRLATKGVKITLAIPLFITKSIPPQVGSITVEPIYDGFDARGFADAESIQAYLDRFKSEGSRTLIELARKLADAGRSVTCIIYDHCLPWALDVAKQLGLIGAVFFTQAFIVCAIYYIAQKGELTIPVDPSFGSTVKVEGLPELEISDLPSFLAVPGSYPAYFNMVLNQFYNLSEADWVFWNTSEELESECKVLTWMAKLWPVKAIGPTVPSAYLDGRIKGYNQYGISLWNASSDTYMKWLNARDPASVVYVSFGSLVSLAAEEVEEMARGLQGMGKHFLWVVQASEAHKLPIGFLEETAEKGVVVPWCNQLEVLAHAAVGCFVTHCGWNSTLEALSLGVPMVGVPQWTDQPTNAKLVKDVWKVGVRAKADEKGVVRREEIESCVKQVMEGESGIEIKRSASEWKECAKKTVDEGGSSYNNIEEFVRKLVE